MRSIWRAKDGQAGSKEGGPEAAALTGDKDDRPLEAVAQEDARGIPLPLQPIALQSASDGGALTVDVGSSERPAGGRVDERRELAG